MPQTTPFNCTISAITSCLHCNAYVRSSIEFLKLEKGKVTVIITYPCGKKSEHGMSIIEWKSLIGACEKQTY